MSQAQLKAAKKSEAPKPKAEEPKKAEPKKTPAPALPKKPAVVVAPPPPKPAPAPLDPFKSCPCHPDLEVSPQGQVRDATSKKPIKSFIQRSTKHSYIMHKSGAVPICKLVADAHLPKPSSPTAVLEHKNGNRQDNSAGNLHYVEPKPAPAPAPKPEEKKPEPAPKPEEKKPEPAPKPEEKKQS
jgi:hypothetical protein